MLNKPDYNKMRSLKMLCIPGNLKKAGFNFWIISTKSLRKPCPYNKFEIKMSIANSLWLKKLKSMG